VFLGYGRYATYAGLVDDGSADFLIRDDDELNRFSAPGGLNWLGDGHVARARRRLADRISELAPSLPRQSGLERKLRFDRVTFLRALLMRQDRAGLGSAIEVRVPFLDEAVVALARATDPLVHLQSAGKHVLRTGFDDVLGHCAVAPKIGFPLPLSQWLQTEPFEGIIDLCNGSGQGAWSRFLGADALTGSMARANRCRDRPPVAAWTLLNFAAWRMWQQDEALFFQRWRERLAPDGRKLMDELAHEQRPTMPDWMPSFLARCASASQGLAGVSKDWREPETVQCLKAVSAIGTAPSSC
jgi:asparagine synthetase B (glutamine-hydrolysing)